MRTAASLFAASRQRQLDQRLAPPLRCLPLPRLIRLRCRLRALMFAAAAPPGALPSATHVAAALHADAAALARHYYRLLFRY